MSTKPAIFFEPQKGSKALVAGFKFWITSIAEIMVVVVSCLRFRWFPRWIPQRDRWNQDPESIRTTADKLSQIHHPNGRWFIPFESWIPKWSTVYPGLSHYIIPWVYIDLQCFILTLHSQKVALYLNHSGSPSIGRGSDYHGHQATLVDGDFQGLAMENPWGFSPEVLWRTLGSSMDQSSVKHHESPSSRCSYSLRKKMGILGYMIYEYIWWYVMTYEHIWWYMMIYEDIWWYMMIYDDIYDDTWGWWPIRNSGD